MVHDLLHFKSIKNVSQLKFREETTFDRQKFLHICASIKHFRNTKTLQLRRTSVYEGIWMPFWSDKQR